MQKNTSVFGLYPDRTTVSDAVSVLHKEGFRPTDISVLASENAGSKDFAHEKHSRAPEGAAMGAAVGAIVGAAVAVAVSLQAGPIMGSGPLVSAGPVLAAFAGAGGGGALGWIAGWLWGFRLTTYVAKRYAGRIRNGGILASVHCDTPEWCARARKSLKNTGARSISCAAESAADFGTTDKPTERAPVLVVQRGEVPVLPATETLVHEIKN
jgi:hypothetical protein